MLIFHGFVQATVLVDPAGWPPQAEWSRQKNELGVGSGVFRGNSPEIPVEL
jgi:hypothetical protein